MAPVAGMSTLVPLAISMQEYTFVSCYNVRGPCAKATCCRVVIGCYSKGYLAWVLLVAPQKRCLHYDLFFFFCAPIIMPRSCFYLCASSPLCLSHSAIVTFNFMNRAPEKLSMHQFSCICPTRPSSFLTANVSQGRQSIFVWPNFSFLMGICFGFGFFRHFAAVPTNQVGPVISYSYCQ